MASLRCIMRQIRTDVRLGSHGWVAPAAGVLSVSTMQLIMVYGRASMIGLDVSILSLCDNLALIVAGSAPFEYRPGIMFTPPLGWLLLQLLMLYLSLPYPLRDLMGMGQQMVLREGRSAWWIAKCAWVLVSVLFYVLLLLITASAWTLAHRQAFSAEIHMASMELAGADFQEAAEGAPVVAGGLPFLFGAFLSAIALALFQLAASLIGRARIAFCGSLVILIASAFAQSPVLPGNLAMLARWEGLLGNGVPLLPSVACACSLASFSAIGGFMWFRRMDLIRGRDRS